MKFYTIFLFVMFVTMFKKAKPSVYHARNYKQVVPVSYTSRILKFLPVRRCFNTLSKCLNKTRYLNEYLFRRHVFNNAQDRSKINFSMKPIPMHERNHASKDKTNSEKFNSPIFNVDQIDKLNKEFTNPPTTKALRKYVHKLNVESEYQYKTKKADTFGISSLKSDTKNSTVSLDAADIEKLEDLDNIEEKVENKENFYDVENIMFPSAKAETMVNSLNDAENIDGPYKNVVTEVNALVKVILNSNTESISEASESHGNLMLRQDLVECEKQDMLPLKLNNTFINQNDFIFALNQFEHQLYLTNFMKFSSLTASKGDSGMSFVQSGLFLEMVLMALSTEVDQETKNEIDQNFALNLSDLDKVESIKQVMSSLPNSSEELKFRWSSRLVLRSGRQLSQKFSSGAAKALQLKIEHFEDTQTPEAMAQVLNRMIEEDSGGAIRDTFEEEDLTENEEAVLLTTLYFRAHWRTAPTLLNGTWLFQDSGNAPSRTIKMIRVNDIMKYMDLPEWDAEAIEIPYLTEGLSLLILVPRGNSLKSLVDHVTGSNLTSIAERMQNIRVAVSLPLYTLRMTLLLPNKLEAMGIPRIVNVSEAGDSFRITQAVQRIMFWAEAGRNAYKDDGLEWGELPEMKIIIDRPYMFYVRWRNLNLIVGNFVF